MANGIIPTEMTFKPLTYTRVGESWNGSKVTNTEAKKLVSELRDWAAQFNHPDAVQLGYALQDIEKLFSCVWTEIDESLTQLSVMPHSDHPEKNLGFALKYLNRWQDRGGRIGNVDY